MGERLPVALGPLAGDASDAGAVEHGHAAERLPVLDVGEMDLHGRQPGDLQRVPQRPRVVRPRAGVEDQAVREVGRLVELLHVLALEVRLEEAHLEPDLTTVTADLLLEPHQTQPAVDLCRAPVERGQVDPVHHRHAIPHPDSNAATAARTSSGATATPVRTSPGASTSAKPTRPLRRFLSRAVAATTAAGSTAGSRRVGRPRAASSSATSSRRAGCAERVSAASSPSPTASPWR